MLRATFVVSVVIKRADYLTTKFAEVTKRIKFNYYFPNIEASILSIASSVSP